MKNIINVKSIDIDTFGFFIEKNKNKIIKLGH